jgi:phosphatidylglycerophosphatase A
MASLNASVTAISLTMAALVLVGSVVCVVCSPAVAASLGKEDPGEIVADELAGQAIVFIAIPTIAPSQIWLVAILGFILFRLFDILKPWPICRLEKLPKGWGILADDLMAGLLASIILQILVKLPIAG